MHPVKQSDLIDSSQDTNSPSNCLFVYCSQGFVAQTLKMDPIEKARRWKRSLDGYITFRKAVLLAILAFAFVLYVGPSIFSWLFQSKSTRIYGKTDLNLQLLLAHFS